MDASTVTVLEARAGRVVGIVEVARTGEGAGVAGVPAGLGIRNLMTASEMSNEGLRKPGVPETG